MSDIKYKWAKGKNSIGLDEKLSLPQFAVAGHRQDTKVIPLSTGQYNTFNYICSLTNVHSFFHFLITTFISNQW